MFSHVAFFTFSASKYVAILHASTNRFWMFSVVICDNTHTAAFPHNCYCLQVCNLIFYDVILPTNNRISFLEDNILWVYYKSKQNRIIKN